MVDGVSDAERTPPLLAGITVLEFCWTLPGPYCGKILADLGARVIKIEPPETGDSLRELMPSMFEVFNEGKESVTLDLKNPLAPEVLSALFRNADVILEGFRPGVAARLGIDWPSARIANAGLVFCSISGFGQNGSLSEQAGHDANYAAASGILGPAAQRSGVPHMPPVPMGDLAAGAIATISVLASLHRRDVTGVGLFCDVAITDVLGAWAAAKASDILVTGVMPEASVQQPPTHGIYLASDGRYLALGAIENHFWERMCSVVDRPDWALRDDLSTNIGRSLAAEEIADVLREVFLTDAAQGWVDRLVAADVPATVVLDMSEAVNSELFRTRRIYEANVGVPAWSVGFPAVIDGNLMRANSPAPQLGRHTSTVLTEFGCSREQMETWEEQGVFGKIPATSGEGRTR